TATADNLVAVAGAGTSLSNYSITTTNGSIQVSPLAITGTAQVNGKVYDGTTVGTGTITLTGLLPADVGSTSASGTFTFANSNAGTKAATVSGVTVNNADYSITVPASAGNATITTAALTITGGTTTTSFDNTTHTNTYSITSGALFGSDVISSVNGLGSGLHANTYTDSGLSASGTGLSNYAISYVPGSLTINPATLSATVTPLVKVYDGTSNISNATALIGVISGTSVSATTSLSLLGSNSGTQTITNNGTTLSGPNAGDYLIVNSSLINNGSNGITPNNAGGNGNHGGTIFINPAPLTITGTKVYDGSANFTYLNMSVSGALNGEKISLITGNAITPSSNAGNYVGTNIINLTIAVAGGNALPSNYQLPSSGTFNVDPAPITNTGSPLTYRAVVTGTLTTAAPSVVGLGAGLGNPNSVIVQMVNNPITNATALPSQNTNANTTANANSANPPIVGNTRTRTQAASTNNRAKSQSSILANNRNKAAGIGNRNTRRNSSANANANQQNNINSNIANFARPGDAGRFVGKGDFTTRSNTYASTRNGLSEVRDRSNSGDTVAKPKNSGGGCGGGKSNTGAVVSTNRSCSQLKAPGDPLANSYHHMEWPGANKSYTGSSAKSIGTIDYNKKMNMNFMINLIILF
ncbi:YDG domain-containing protein, partial [Polynucleobacter kasalickyi]